MDQIHKVPKILSSVKELQNPEANTTEISHMKKEMKTFMQDIKKEFTTMVSNYEHQLSTLKM